MYKQVYVVEKLNANKASPEEQCRIQAATDVVYKAVELANSQLVPIHRLAVADHFPELLLIAVGGDGTMLEAMRGAARLGATAIGINLGNVGFLTDISAKNLLAEVLAEIISGTAECTIEERTVIALNGSSWNDIACNEISISRIVSDSMINYRLHVGCHDAGVHKANSVLISTPTGSTAYSLSAGGALMMPDVDAFQIVPVAPMAMTTRPIITPLVPIIVEAWGDGIAIRTDGVISNDHDRVFTERSPLVTMITPFSRKVKVLHPTGWNYFNVLSDKLGWIKK